MQVQNSCNDLKLAISMGDPAGIGPEVILKALKLFSGESSSLMTVFGNRASLWQTYHAIEQAKGSVYVAQHLANPDHLDLCEVPISSMIALGQESAESGAASFAALRMAIQQTLAGDFAGIITGPIAKSAWKRAGYAYPGQTEFLAKQANVDRYGMFFVANSPIASWQLRVLLATTHIPLHQVPLALNPQLLTRKLDLLIETLDHSFDIQTPRIAIAGLNPHSGEQGQLGTEEVKWLIPWIQEMGDCYPQVQLDGPIPPDTMWVKPGQAWFGTIAHDENPHDAYLALYHDQGLIPTKLMAFDRAVNTTIGLPFVRTSPDHGTAFGIAGQGVADATSMTAAIALAYQLATQRSNTVQDHFSPLKSII